MTITTLTGINPYTGLLVVTKFTGNLPEVAERYARMFEYTYYSIDVSVHL